MSETRSLHGLETLRKILERKRFRELSLYDKGWMAFYSFETQKENFEFFKQLEIEIEDILTSEGKISTLFFSLDNTIGLMLGIYSLLLLDQLDKKFIPTIKKIIRDLEEREWLDYDEELIFSISVLHSHLNLNINLKEIFENAIEQHDNFTSNVRKNEIRAKVFALLAFSLEEQLRKEYDEDIKILLDDLLTKKCKETISSDIELSIIFSLGLTCLLENDYLNDADAKEYRDVLFKFSYSELIKLTENLQLVRSIIDNASLLKETGRIRINEELKSIIKVCDDELRIDLKKFPSPSLNSDLISKFLILAWKAGFDKPYFLSKKEYDVYLQIKNEVKMYRRVRKVELISLMIISGFFSLIFSIYLLMQINVINQLMPIILFSLSIVAVQYMIFSQIYKKGHISIKEIWEKLWKELLGIIGRSYK